jgi:type IV secretory pathway TrbD component
VAIAAFGAAILLLGVAALPRAAISDPRLTDLVVRHRAELVVTGAAAFVAGVLALTFP